MREFMKLIESLNEASVEPQAPKTVERRAPEAPKAPVMEQRAPAPASKAPGRLREAMEAEAKAKAKIKAMESAKAELKARVESLRTRKTALEERTSGLRAHPEFNLLRELLARHGADGPSYGSVDYFIAEAYARGLNRETGMHRDAIMKEALVSLFDKPSRRKRPEPQQEQEPDESSLPQDDMSEARPRDAEPAEESPFRNVAENKIEPKNDVPSLLAPNAAFGRKTVNHAPAAHVADHERAEWTGGEKPTGAAERIHNVLNTESLDLSNNPWGIEWTISEDISDLSPITPHNNDIDADEEEDDLQHRTAAAMGGSMPDKELTMVDNSLTGQIGETVEPPVNREVWSEGNVRVRQEGDRYPVYLGETISQTFLDEDGAMAYANHLLSGEADITTESRTPAPAVTDEAVLAEARYYAQLAGIGAKPKKIEATGELADMLVLAGIRR